MTTAKNEFIGLHENCNSMGSELTLDGGVYWREFSRWEVGVWTKFWLLQELPPSFPQEGKLGGDIIKNMQ